MFGGPSITHCLTLEPDLVRRGGVDVATQRVESWDYLSRDMESRDPPKASFEIPTCKPDMVREDFLPHLLGGSDHALQPICFLRKLLGPYSPR